MPTLLQINTVINSGSTGRIAEEIGQTAITAGWRSVIAYGRNPRPSQSETIRIGSKFDTYLHALRSRIFDDHGFASRRATENFIRELEKLNPDIVHLHNIHGYYLNIEVLFRHLAKSGIPVVWTLHDCWAMTGHCACHDFIKCDRWQAGCFSCPQKKTYPASFLFDRSRRNWERKRELFSSVKNLTLVPVSNWLADLVKKSFLGDKNIVRIYNGVNTKVFVPASDNAAVRERYGLGRDKFVVMGCAGTWSDKKGLADFIRLQGLVGDDVDIVLVGLNDKQVAALPAGIKGIKRTENVEELSQLYSSADLFVNPTLEDSFNCCNIEALACGTPVFTYRTGGTPETVDAATGFVAEQGDLGAIVAAIERVRVRGKAAYSSACRSRALACFRKEDRYSEYLDLYERLLAQ